MKQKSDKPTPKRSERGRDVSQLKNPRRRTNCETSQSLELGKKQPPGDRGACEQETEVQGSE